MSDDQKGPDKFGGPRKPRATFGDVMLGIPAGRGGEREERPRGERRREEPASTAPGETPAETPRKEPRKPERRRARGPLVVVRRASGAIETRGPETPKAEAPASEEPAAPPAEAAAPVAPVTPVLPLCASTFQDAGLRSGSCPVLATMAM